MPDNPTDTKEAVAAAANAAKVIYGSLVQQRHPLIPKAVVFSAAFQGAAISVQATGNLSPEMARKLRTAHEDFARSARRLRLPAALNAQLEGISRFLASPVVEEVS